MNQIKSISEVITFLDVIVQQCTVSKSRAGYFAALYKRMTVAVADGIANGVFEDPKRMEELDIVFAQRYLSAYYSFEKGTECTASWQGAFEGCGNQKLVVLQQLLLGINTHINLDLAIAAASVAPGEKIHALKKDFMQINVLIASLIDDVQHCLEQVWWPMRLLRDVVNRQGMAVLNFSIGKARDASWANAVLLAGSNSEARATQIQLMDGLVKQVGNRIIHPGRWPQLLLRLVRFTEYDDTARTIRLIDTTVVK